MKKIILVIILPLLVSSCLFSTWKNTDNSNSINSQNTNWEIISKDNNSKSIVTFKVDYENDFLVGDLMKKIKADDFKNLELDAIWEESLKNLFYNFLIKKKALTDSSIDYCDSLKTLNAIRWETWDYCRGEFYLYDLIVNKNFSVCENFWPDYKLWKVMNSALTNDEFCNEIQKFITAELYSENDIEKLIWKIQGGTEIDVKSSTILLAAFNNTDKCWDIDSLGTRMECYSYLHKNEFLDWFDSKIYKKLLDVKLLYNE